MCSFLLPFADELKKLSCLTRYVYEKTMNSLLHTCLNIEMLVVLMLLYNFMIMHILYLNFLAAKNPYSYDKMPYNIYIYIYV